MRMDRHVSNPSADGRYIANDQDARCVALAQDRRGHGQSTFAWYLARALVESGLRVLVVDLTGRHGRLDALAGSGAIKNLGTWKPPTPRPTQLAALIRSARQQTRGRVDVLMLDTDGVTLESGGGFVAGIDYVLALVDPTENGQRAADHLAERLDDAPPPQGQLGVVFCRANETEAEHFPQQTENRHLPIVGYFPADYLLAGDDVSQHGHPVVPHEGYLRAVERLSRMVKRLARLRRITLTE
jgi:hypothetical protein